MKFLSVCSGIEAASCAWKPLGWEAVAFSEIEPFPCSVLAHHYPNVPNWGDMTKFKEWPDVSIDLLCGGTPCQSFSVAGLRKGLDDPRGNLMLTYGAIAAKYRPKWLVWENVPGVLSSNGGRDFGSFLGLLGQLGYGFAYRVLDAQYFGLAQRRRRVFVVGCLGDWRSAAAVLFEQHCLRRDTAPRREAGQGVATSPTPRTGGNRTGGDRPPGADVDTADSLQVVAPEIARCVTTREGNSLNSETTTMVAHSLRGEDICPSLDAKASGGGRMEAVAITEAGSIAATLRTGGNDHADVYNIAAVASHNRQDPDVSGGITRPLGAQDNGMAVAFDTYNQAVAPVTHTLRAGPGKGDSIPAVAMRESGQGYWMQDDIAGTIDANMGMSGHANRPAVIKQPAMQVRRLTPTECEKLQGFPPGYTAIPWRGKPADQCPDGPRYKALGNSWAVPCAQWIGQRIEAVEQIAQMRQAA